MPVIVISILIQLCLVVHIIKTGRSTTWIWVIVMLPLVGSLAYIILEILPELTGSRSGKRARQKLQQAINPDKEFKEAVKEFSAISTVDNSLKLANECIEKGLFAEARDLFQKSLRGVHADDPVIMYGLAKSEFGLAEYLSAKNSLEQLIEKNPDYRNQDAHLLYARSLEKIGDDESAEHEFETLHGYASGPVASFFYAKFLQKKGQTELARKIFSEIVAKSEHSGRHYNELYREVISAARKAI